MLLKLLAVTYLIYALSLSVLAITPIHAMISHPSTLAHNHPKCTQLWVYTEPVQKGSCVVFKHQSSAEITAANKSNTEFNSGIMAAGKATIGTKCVGSKSFCEGWDFDMKFQHSSTTVRNSTAASIRPLHGNSSSDEGECDYTCQIKLMKSDPGAYGHLNGVWDGQRSARDSPPVCGGYNSTAETNQCYFGYDKGFFQGCQWALKHDRSSYYETNGEYGSCDSFHRAMKGWWGPVSINITKSGQDDGDWNCNHPYDSNGAPDLTKDCPKGNSSNSIINQGKCVDFTCQIVENQAIHETNETTKVPCAELNNGGNK